MMKRLLLCAVVVGAIASASLAAPILLGLAPYTGETSSEARAMTPDGRWVAGSSGTARGVLWDTQNPGVAINVLGGGMQSEYVRGLAYRTEPYLGRQELVMLGKTSGTTGPTYWEYRPSDNTWGPKLRHTNEVNAIPASNALAAHATQSDAVLATWGGATTGSSKVGKVWGGTDTVAPSTSYDTKGTTQESGMQGVARTGRAVGWRKDTAGVAQNYVLDFVDDGVAGTPLAAYFNGLDGTTKGSAYAVSGDGSIVGGYSPVSDGRTGNWPYKAALNADRTLASIVELPSLNAAATSNQGIVYGISENGRWAVGRDYSNGMDQAVLWDLTTLAVTDLTAFATQQGILGDFQAVNGLRRAYSVGVDALGQPVISGLGVNTAGQNRAFVLTLPEPATLALLGIGGIALLRRRR